VTQYADNGSVAQGTLYVSRPGRMRLAYDPPSPVLLVADGTFVIYYDKRLQQVSYLPIGSTPAWFLLRDRISLGGGVRVTGFEHRGGVIRVTLVESEEPQAGSVTLTFTDQPLALRQWTVTDAQGHHTTVALSNVRIGGKIDPDLFVFNEPHRKEPGGR
jgi:outer membrane lipoprotein-sorting protein